MPSPVITLLETFATSIEALTGLYDDGSGFDRFRRMESPEIAGSALAHRMFDFEPPLKPKPLRSTGAQMVVWEYDVRFYLYVHQGKRAGLRFSQGVLDDLRILGRWWAAQHESGWGVSGIELVIMDGPIAEPSRHRYLFPFRVEAQEIG